MAKLESGKNGRLVINLEASNSNIIGIKAPTTSMLKKASERKKALFLAVIMGVCYVVSGCSKQEKVTVNIPISATINGTLDTIDELTTMNEFLYNDVFINESDKQETTFGELLAYYNESRKNEDLPACNDALYKIGRMILKAQVAEALQINLEDITGFSYEAYQQDYNKYQAEATVSHKVRWLEEVSGGIKVPHETEETNTYNLEGELIDLALNVNHAQLHVLSFNTKDTAFDVDYVYESYVEAILVSTQKRETKNSSSKETEYYIYGELDSAKVDAFTKVKTK